MFYTMMELYFELSKFNDEGTVFGSITKDDLFALQIVKLSNQKRSDFDSKVAKIDTVIQNNEEEIAQLSEMRAYILSQLAN